MLCHLIPKPDSKIFDSLNVTDQSVFFQYLVRFWKQHSLTTSIFTCIKINHSIVTNLALLLKPILWIQSLKSKTSFKQLSQKTTMSYYFASHFFCIWSCWVPKILFELRRHNCPKNLYQLAVIISTIEKKIFFCTGVLFTLMTSHLYIYCFNWTW